MILARERITWVLLLLALASAWPQTVRRGRDEGTSSIPASNVMGNGNFTLSLGGGGEYRLLGYSVYPEVGARVGITDIMELSGGFVPWLSGGLGPIETRLQFTTPANDKLRFFGAALFVELFLSTRQDTGRPGASKSRPEYNSYPAASLVADFDWLAVQKRLPLKTYLKVGLVDNPDLLVRYDQLAVLAAAEWKGMAHSLFINAGLALYREKASKTAAGDASYGQRYAWIEPGGRLRLFSRFSLVGSIRTTLYRALKDDNPLDPELFGVSLRFEAPVYLRETNAEAIRTLVLLGHAGETTGDSAPPPAAMVVRNIVGAVGDTLDTLGSFDFIKEREALLLQRADTQRKMAEIEKLLAGLDQSDSLTAAGGAGTAGTAPDSAGRGGKNK
jgi:hypothetical protein